MQKENIRLRMLVVLLSVVTLSMLAIWNRANQDNIRLRSRNELIREEKFKFEAECDSLKLENFNLGVEIGRHQITREEILPHHPKAKKEYDEYYEHQTE